MKKNITIGMDSGVQSHVVVVLDIPPWMMLVEPAGWFFERGGGHYSQILFKSYQNLYGIFPGKRLDNLFRMVFNAATQ